MKDKMPEPKKVSAGGSTIGDISSRLGYDVRDVWMNGYSDSQIDGVLNGQYSLADLLKMEPEGNDRTPLGREILSAKNTDLA